MKIIYTDTGKRELISFQERQKDYLEDMVSAKKFVFGDDTLEITGADVREASIRIKPSRSLSASRFTTIQIASYVYMAGGLLVFMAGVFWPYIQALYRETPVALSISAAGLLVSAMGLLMQQMYRARIRRIMEMEDLDSIKLKNGMVFYGGVPMQEDIHGALESKVVDVKPSVLREPSK